MMRQVSTRNHNEMVLKDLEEGDLVQFDRGYFSHWGVYIGDENIVHLVTGGNSTSGSSFSANYSSNYFSCSSSSGLSSENCSSNGKESSSSTSGSSSFGNGISNGKGIVIMESFWTVAKDSMAKKNNHLDTSLKPLPKEKIIARAKGKIGTYNYNVVWNNCEHFATWCRNDKKWSKQAENVLEIATIVGALAVIVLSLMGLMRFVRRN